MNDTADSNAQFKVYVVDDDPDVRHSLGLLMHVRGYACELFSDAEHFVAALTADFKGCLITDIRMPGMSGLALQQELVERGCKLPVIVLTGHGDIESARRCLRARAVDFLLKPFQEADLLTAIEQGFALERERLARMRADADAQARVASLTAREREVAALLATGAQNLTIADRLAISPRTVEIHKARCIEKLGARSLADIVRIADRTGLRASEESATGTSES